MQLVLWPWLLGSMRPLPQEIGFLSAAAGFSLALIRSRHSTRIRLSRLLRFPVFWLGLGLFTVVAIQGINPSWRYESDGVRWWLRKIPAITWLPSGVSAPFARMNAGRVELIFSTVWMMVCAIWIGVSRRRSIKIILAAIVANGLILEGLLAYQKVADARAPEALSALTSYSLTASFIYRNHAAAYFSLASFCAWGLALWLADESRRRLRKSSPAPAVALAALLLAGAVPCCLSRGGVLILIWALSLQGAWFYCFHRRGRREQTNRAGYALTAIFAIFVGTAFYSLDFSRLIARFEVLASSQAHDPSVSSRLLLRQAAFRMLREHGIRGIGLGSFRFIFTTYGNEFPSLYQGGMAYWEHAHCDLLEFPVEWGLAGDLLAGTAIAIVVTLAIRNRLWASPIAAPLAIGCLATVVHGSFDFPFQSPPILGLWAVMLTIAAWHLQLTRAVRRQAGGFTHRPTVES